MKGQRWIEVVAAVGLTAGLAAVLAGWQAWTHYKRSLNRALTVALNREDAAAVRTLLARGADIRTTGTSGNTVLMIAAASGEKRLLADAFRAGPDVNAVNFSTHTALTYAVVYQQPEAVKQLLDRGADPNRGARGATPLTWAARRGHLQISRMLLDAGADPNIRLQYDGSSPLMRAAEHGHTAVVRLLLERRADPSLRDLRRETAAIRARKHGHQQLVVLLERAGAGHPAKQTAAGKRRPRW
jgi:protein DGCR14